MAVTVHHFPSNASLAPRLLREEHAVPFELALGERARERPAFRRVFEREGLPQPWP